jgi:hypothetical protein
MRRSRNILCYGGVLAIGILALGAVGAADSVPAPPSPALKLLAQPATPLLVDTARPAEKQPAPGPAERGKQQFVRPPWPVAMNVALDVLVDGKPLPTVRYRGKTYLPVPREGMPYELRVWNHGPRRIAAVLSVDGLSVINGKPASESDPGYVVAPYSSIVIKGWRRNMDTVAAFRFVERGKSYAALTGRPENIGVIGLVAFEEAGGPPYLGREKHAGPAPEAARRAVGSIGTEYGRELDSRIYYVPFVRSTNRRAITLYYDTVDALRRAGVPVDERPVPFPADSEFAPPPPGYRGK